MEDIYKHKRDDSLYYPCDEHGNIDKSDFPRNPLCPCCKEPVWRESADVGVGVIYGPWGCSICGWSSDPYYDCRSGPCESQKELNNEYYVNCRGMLFKRKQKEDNL